jgi:drug/metabolite transporter (DMT)-like permease
LEFVDLRDDDLSVGHRRGDRAGPGRAFGTLGQVTRRHMRLHLWRNLAHFTGQNLWFYAITVSPLALVFALEFTSPLWVMVLAAMFLGERLTRGQGDRRADRVRGRAARAAGQRSR